MIPPRIGSNATSSFFDFDTAIGRLRFGVENGKFFFQKNLNSTAPDDIAKYSIPGSVTNQSFAGKINLSNEYTHYANWTANSNAEVAIDGTPAIGGSAEIRMIGDGTHTPLFSAFTKSSGSEDFSPTLAAINKVIFYYDGTEVFYSITVL